MSSNNNLIQLLSLKKLSHEWLANKGLAEFQANDIDDFLRYTALSEISERQRLVALAMCTETWSLFSNIFKHAVDRFPNNASGLYGICSLRGLKILEEGKEDESTRIAVANDLEVILSKAREINEAGFYRHTGLLYYFHPLRHSNERDHLNNSIFWWKLGVQLSIEEEEIDSYMICHLAHAYFEVGDLGLALSWYQRLNFRDLPEDGRFGREIANERFLACQNKRSF